MTDRDLHVVLVHPEIHWNTGAVGRTCLAAGAQLHLVEPLGFSLDDRQIRRAGLDYWPRVAPRVWPSWSDFENQIAELGTAFFFTREAGRTLWEMTYPTPTVLVFGRESVGLPPEIRERHRESLVGIPMVGPEVRSLNLSNAVALGCYEVRRQWVGNGRQIR